MIITSEKIEGIKMSISRWVADGGDGRVFALNIKIPSSCGKHSALEEAIFRNGPPLCPERNMTTDEFGVEWIDLEKILAYLDALADKCPVCERSV